MLIQKNLSSKGKVKKKARMKSELIVQKSNSGKYQKVMLQFLNFSICILARFITHSLLSQFLLSKFHSENNFSG